MSLLRKELGTAKGKYPDLGNVTVYLLILRAVEGQRGLIHGALHKGEASCAIGSFFDLHAGKLSLPTSVVDEVAAVNDAVPHLSPPKRKRHVVEWLRWKLGTLGMPQTTRRTKKQTADETMAQLARQIEDAARETNARS